MESYILKMNLSIDIGNSFVKYAVFNRDDMLCYHRSDNIEKNIIGNVAKPGFHKIT